MGWIHGRRCLPSRARALFVIFLLVLFTPQLSDAAASNPNNPHNNGNDHNDDGHEDNGQVCRFDDFSETCEAGEPTDPVFPESDTIPAVIPVMGILLDDQGKELSDGEFAVALTLRDQDGNVIYAEDTMARVTDGLASVLIGTGVRTAGDSLSMSSFASGSVITVEALLDCTETAQVLSHLGSSPYSFVSETALGVVDGSLVFEDLSEGLFEDIITEVLERIEDEGGSEGDFVETTGGTMTGNLVLLNANLVMSDGFLIDGTDLSVLAATVSGLSTSVSDLSTGLSGLSGTVSGLTATVSGLQNDVNNRVLKTGDTMTGDLHFEGANITLTEGATVDGIDVDAAVGELQIALTDLEAEKLSVSGGFVTGDLFLQGAFDIDGNVGIGSQDRFTLNDDKDSFLTESLEGEINLVTDNRGRIAFLSDDHTAIFTSGNVIARGMRRFSDSNLKTSITPIVTADVMNAIRTDTLNGVLYQCNADGSANLYQDINQPPGGGGGGVTPVDFDVLCDDTTTFHYGIIAQVLSSAPNLDMPSVGDTDLVSTETMRTGSFETVDYDQITPMLVEAVQYLDAQLTGLDDRFLNEDMSDDTSFDLRIDSGADLLWYSDAAETALTASVDGATGNVTFVGSLTIQQGSLSDDAIVSADVAENVLTDNDLANGSVGSLELIDGSVTSTDILDETITQNDIATAAVGSDEVVDNSLTGSDIQESTLVLTNLIDDDDLQDSAVDGGPGGEIEDGTVTTEDLADNTVTDNDLASGSVGSLELQDNSITDNDLASGAVGVLELQDNIITDNDIVPGSVGTSEIADNSIQESDLKAVNAASDEYCLTFEETLGDFEWQDCAFVATGDFVKRAGDTMTGSLALLNAPLALDNHNAFYLDGLGGGTYLKEDVNDRIEIVTGNLTSARFTGNYFAIPSQHKLYLDGGNSLGNTYLSEDVADRIEIVTGGLTSARFTGSYFAIPSQHKLYLDGGNSLGNTYLLEDVTDRIEIVTGGLTSARFTGNYFAIPSQHKLYLDGGNSLGNTYLTETVADRIEFVTGNQTALQLSPGFAAIQSEMKLLLDGDQGDTYFKRIADNQIGIYAGNRLMFNIDYNSGFVGVESFQNFYVNPGARFYLDGGEDTYLHRSGDNVMGFVAGNVPVTNMTPLSMNMKRDITMDNAACGHNCLVDGVDVSELDNRVDRVSSSLFAYGTMTTAGGISCVGFNINSNCTFQTLPPNTNYIVTFSVDASSGAGCGSFAPFCATRTKSTSAFTLRCDCPSGGTYNAKFDFVVSVYP